MLTRRHLLTSAGALALVPVAAPANEASKPLPRMVTLRITWRGGDRPMVDHVRVPDEPRQRVEVVGFGGGVTATVEVVGRS